MPQLPDPASSHSSSHTPFRLTEKHFKNRSNPLRLPSLRQYPVIDLSRPEKQEDDEVWRAGWWSTDTSRPRKGKERARGERPDSPGDAGAAREIRLRDGRPAYVVAEGCILIPQYLNAEDQRLLLRVSLAEYTRPPNPLSVDTHYDMPPDLFEMYATGSTEMILPKHLSISNPQDFLETSISANTNGSGPSTSRQTIETTPATVIGYDEILAKNKTWKGDEASEKVKPKTAEQLLKELRWANLGWVYRWSTKAYDFTPDTPIAFPSDLREICTRAVGDVPWNEVFAGQSRAPDWSTWSEDYAPDTGIVNFYQLNDTLMGHVDRAELDPSRPLVSISLGHSCIFLLGSSSRDDPPQPIILRSGDVLIMSGKGRQSYHGVPRIMEGTLPAHFVEATEDDETMRAVKQFISTARVNINARQVFPPGFQRPVGAEGGIK